MDDNKKLNIILISVIIFLILGTIYVLNYIKNNEDSKISFNLNEIKNIKYSDNNNSFYTDGKKITFIINNETIYNNYLIEFNSETGEIIKDKLYLRNQNDKYIIIWYDNVEYKLYNI